MKKTERSYDHIKGWGIDANPMDVPAYPMKHRTENDNKGMIWQRPSQQVPTVEVLHSNERPTLSAVFGTPNPPTGLSGEIRRFAFKYSESKIQHWIALLIADRINMFEGIADDFKKGHVPNIFAELGGKSEIKHNPKGFARKLLVGFALGAVIVAVAKRKS
jgi:hypothetical protein